MNLKQLEVLLAVAETGSFSRGAEKTFLTQSTVSQHVSALEAEFGIRLLDRTGRGALPTEGGKILLRHAREIIAAARQAEREVKRFAGLEEADLRIGASSIPSIYLIPNMLPVLLKNHPAVRVTIVQGESAGIIEKLAAEDVELAVVGRKPDEALFDSHPLNSDQVSLVVAEGHRWAGKEIVPLAEFAAEPLLLREPGSGTGAAVMDALRNAGVQAGRLNVRAYLGSNEAIKRGISGGAGVGFVSSLALEGEEGLVSVALEGITIRRRFYVAARAGRALSPAAEALRTVLLASAGRSAPLPSPQHSPPQGGTAH